MSAINAVLQFVLAETSHNFRIRPLGAGGQQAISRRAH